MASQNLKYDSRGGYSKINLAVNSLFQVILSSILIVFSIPVFLVISILIKLVDGGPVFYKGERLGINKKPYNMYKFRTLIPNAENIIGAELLTAKHKMVTRIGKYLRDTRLDELPQLFNILKGDMDFVGPRPERRAIYEKICKHIKDYDMRFIIKPGLIGYSQLFTPYSSPKRIRAVLDNSFLRKKQKLWWDIIFVIYTILVVVIVIFSKLFKFAWYDITWKKLFHGYGENRILERVTSKNAYVQIGTTVNGEEVFIADGELVDINEEAFLIKTNHKIDQKNTVFKFITRCKYKFRKRVKQKVALCNGEIYKERETNDNRFKYSYVIMYTPNSSLNCYMIHQYFLMESMVKSTPEGSLEKD